MIHDNSFNWNAAEFFKEKLTQNKLAASLNFRFAEVSSLEGFEQALHLMQSSSAILAVSDDSQGYIDINNAPHTRRIKTVFMAMRHPIDDMKARARCFANMRELFRQFASVLILEQTRLANQCVHIDQQISFNEIDRYFFSGAACAFFQIAIDNFTDLRYNPAEWII